MTKHMSQVKDQKISEENEELQGRLREMADQCEQQKRDLEMLKEKGWSRVNVADSDGYNNVSSCISRQKSGVDKRTIEDSWKCSEQKCFATISIHTEMYNCFDKI